LLGGHDIERHAGPHLEPRQLREPRQYVEVPAELSAPRSRGTRSTQALDEGGGRVVVVIVHCFRCDDVVEVSTDGEGPLWCSRCEDDVLGPPSDTGDRSVRWSPSGLLLAGQVEEPPGALAAAPLARWLDDGCSDARDVPGDLRPDRRRAGDRGRRRRARGRRQHRAALDREVRSRSWIRFSADHRATYSSASSSGAHASQASTIASRSAFFVTTLSWIRIAA